MPRIKVRPKKTLLRAAVGFKVDGVMHGKAVPRAELDVNLLKRIKTNPMSILRVVDLQLMLDRHTKRLVSLRRRGAINKDEYYALMKKFEALHETCVRGTCSCTGVRAQSFVDLMAFGIKHDPTFPLYYATLKNKGKNAFSIPKKKRVKRKRDVVLESEERGRIKRFKDASTRSEDRMEVEMATNQTARNEIAQRELTEGVTKALQSLAPVAQKVVDLRFGLSNGKPASPRTIARTLRIYEDEVNEILKESIAVLSKQPGLKALV